MSRNLRIARAVLATLVAAGALAFGSSESASAADDAVQVTPVGNTNTLHISWSAQPGVAAYQVFVMKNPDCAYGDSPGWATEAESQILGPNVTSTDLTVPSAAGRHWVKVYKLYSYSPDPVPMLGSAVIVAAKAPVPTVAISRAGENAHLTFAAPQDCDAPRAPATGYRVLLNPGGRSWSISATAPTLDVTGLDPGKAYNLLFFADSAQGPGRGTAKIAVEPTVAFDSMKIAEGHFSHDVTFTLRMSQTLTDEWVTIRYRKQDVSATGGIDYYSGGGFGYIDVPPGATTVPLVIRIYGERNRESDERFKLVVESATNNVKIGKPGIVILANDDT